MDSHKRTVKCLIVIFCRINIPLYVAMFYFRYLTMELLANDILCLLWSSSIALVYLPFEALIYRHAKLAAMKKCSMFFGLCLIIHTTVSFVSILVFISTVIGSPS